MMFSTILRRTHMYLGLFLAPWMAMYALSTIVMNHRALFRGHGGPPPLEKESERIYPGALPEKPSDAARQILKDLGLEGTHTVNASSDGNRITIARQDPVTPRRIVFTRADRRLVVEKEVFATPAFLERLHRRRGYLPGSPLQNAWAFSVDLAIVAMVFWVASGLWMWWEMRKTRFLGGMLALSGCVVFLFFLFRI